MTQADQQLIDTTALEAVLHEFAAERNWQRFHSPKNLAMALTGEVGELVELFQWQTEEESKAAMNDQELAEKIRHEVADVMLYLVRLSSILGIDLNQALQDKLHLNAQKYPKPV